MPGYTGHIPGRVEDDNVGDNIAVKKHIPGYGGYIPGVKSENVFGETYGKVTHQSAAGTIQKGIDQPPDLKYQSMFKNQYVNHAENTHETVAQLVGPIPPETIYKFYGMSAQEGDQIVQNRQYEANQSAFYGGIGGQTQKEVPKQSDEDAMNVFYGVQKKQTASKLGEPIPGYSGVNRRIQADNLFGMTYAEARRKAMESQNRITADKGDTLKMTQNFIPEYERPKQDDYYY